MWLSDKDLELTQPAERAFESPIPFQVVSNGEYLPPPRTRKQAQVAAEIEALSARLSRRQGLSRRQFLRTGCGMATAFLAMNSVYGPVFAVDKHETEDPEAAREREQSLAKQFIFDVQLHFVKDDYPSRDILGLRRLARDWNPALQDERLSLERIKFENFLKEVYLDSQTTLGLLSGAPSDDPAYWFLSNAQIARARQLVNGLAGSKRLFSHAVFTPGQPGWLDDLDRAIEEHHPDSWKGYTLGDPLGESKYPWRLDDEELVYPAYEKMVKAGIKNVCIHKGLIPPDYERSMPELWPYATVDDVGKTAQNWPQLNFVIYHSALASFVIREADVLGRFEKQGRIPWVSDLAEIPQSYGVSNVYAEIGTSFASSAITHPAFCAAMLGILIKGMGADHVLWGTDSVWYGSPQWQIEALRRIEIPQSLRERYGFTPLGPADSPVKNALFGLNAARLYDIQPERDYAGDNHPAIDGLGVLKAQYRANGGSRNNLAYGYIHR